MAKSTEIYIQKSTVYKSRKLEKKKKKTQKYPVTRIILIMYFYTVDCYIADPMIMEMYICQFQKIFFNDY